MTQTTENEEIDLKQLIQMVIATRYWVSIGLVIISMLFWAFQIASNLARPSVLTYETRVNLTFPGVDISEYPNGSPFSITDIVSPVVLNNVYKNNDLAEFVTLPSFVRKFTIRPYTPDKDVILAKYSDQLSRKNLSVAELEELQIRLNDEIRRASADAVTISFSGTSIRHIPAKLIEKVMLDVVQEWARHMVEEVGVTQIGTAIYTSSVLNEESLSAMDYLIAFELLLDRLDLLQKNIVAIGKLPNGVVVEDDVSGLTLPDLEKAVSDVKRYRVAPLINPVRSLGIAKSPELVQLYFENEMIELKRNLAFLRDKRENIGDAYSNYIQSSKISSGGSSPSDAAAVTTQIVPEFFDKIVQLTNSGADISYRQKLNTLLLDSSDEISLIKSEVSRIEEILSSMKGQNSATQVLRESYSEQVNEQMPSIITQLVTFFDVSERLYEKLSTQNLGGIGVMYQFSDGKVDRYESKSVLSDENIRKFALLCVLTIILLVPLGMIWNSLRVRRVSSD